MQSELFKYLANVLITCCAYVCFVVQMDILCTVQLLILIKLQGGLLLLEHDWTCAISSETLNKANVIPLFYNWHDTFFLLVTTSSNAPLWL